LGTVIALVLAFRTNSSYGRWWEARTIWGAIVNDSRTWARQLLEFVDDNEGADESVRSLVYRQIAWCYSLTHNLRGQKPTDDLEGLLKPEELASYAGRHNVPNDLLLRQGMELRRLYQSNRIELFQWIELEETLTRITNSMGGCERIKNTPFPFAYSRIVDACIFVFVFFLPFSLVNVPAPALIGTSLSLSLSFLLIERVAIYMEDPFQNRQTDTPMLALSRTIEINLREMLGESDPPPKLEPIDGVLM
jgi:putative membrane protein